MKQYASFEKWLNKYLCLEISVDVKAINFNLYEASISGDDFDVQLIGAPQYDSNDPDWACDAIFTTGEDLYNLKANGWEECIQIIVEYVKRYLAEGKYASKISNLCAITVGFVDGDLEVVMENC